MAGHEGSEVITSFKLTILPAPLDRTEWHAEVHHAHPCIYAQRGPGACFLRLHGGVAARADC